MNQFGGLNRELFSQEGYLLDDHHWTFELGEQIANQLGVSPNAELWHLVSFIREIYLQRGKLPIWPKLLKDEEFNLDLVVNRFQGPPHELLAKISGLPGPMPIQENSETKP